MINQNDLLEYLYNKILENNLGLEIIKLDKDFASRYLPDKKLIIVNSNWRKPEELAFVVGHEFGHFLNHDSGILYYSSPSSNCKEEHQADLQSLYLLFDYAKNHGQSFTNPMMFLQAYGIPERMLNAATTVIKNDNDLIF